MFVSGQLPLSLIAPAILFVSSLNLIISLTSCLSPGLWQKTGPNRTLLWIPGHPAGCGGFLLQVALHIEMQPQKFPTECSKVAFLISLLSGLALSWAKDIWNANSVINNSFDAFTNTSQRYLAQLLVRFLFQINCCGCVREYTVLLQLFGEPPRLQPLVHYSRNLTPAEQNYDIGNRESLAIKLALEEWLISLLCNKSEGKIR